MTAFQPLAPTVTRSVSGSSASVALGYRATGNTVLMLTVEPGGSTVFVALGGSGVVATTADMPVLPGTQVIIGWYNPANTYIAAITATGTATLYATPGGGM